MQKGCFGDVPGAISPEKLSGGAKTLLMAMSRKDDAGIQAYETCGRKSGMTVSLR